MFRAAVNVPDRREVWEWAGGTLPDKSDAAIDFGRTTAFQGVYDVNNVPWTREFLRACNNPMIREVTFIAPPQDSGKTKAAETYLAYRIVNAPTNAQFNTSTNVKAEQWSETRWDPMLESTRGIRERFSDNQNEKKRRRIVFKDGTFLLIQGAETEGNRASDSVELQINDECYMYQRPWLKELHERTNAYRDTRKIINVSVGGQKGSELEERFLAGNQLEWHHHCPKCARPFAYVFDHRRPDCNIRFDLTKAIQHADGRLDLSAFEKSIYVECPACQHRMTYDRERLRTMNLRGCYVAKNPKADPTIVSLHVNSFALGREPWVQILEPWVRMNLRGGVLPMETLKEFITKKLADFWEEKPFVVTRDVKLAGWTRAEMKRPGSWSEELFRVMTCDNQRGAQGDIPHRWFVGVSFSKRGVMRVFDGGRVNEWNDLRAKQLELGIRNPTEDAPGPWVLVDRRWDPVEVDERCAEFKWYGSMGAEQAEFTHPPWSQFAGTRQLFSEPRQIDVGFGSAEAGRTFATYYLWSSQRGQDLLAHLRNMGRVELARDLTDPIPDLATQMNSHRQIVARDKRGNEKRVWVKIGDTPDHVYDCITQAAIIGAMAGIFEVPKLET